MVAAFENEICQDPAVFVPRDAQQALAWLTPVLELDAAALNRWADEEALRAWAAVAYLCPGLHPDEATDHGDAVEMRVHDEQSLPAGIDKRLLGPSFVQSGWPVALAPLAEALWRRYDEGKVADGLFYNVQAARAGLELAETAFSAQVDFDL